MPAGRPSGYRKEFCERVIELGRQGKSKAFMCADLEVSRQTIENWAEQHKEFFDAITHAMILSQVWWEDAGQNGMVADKFNASVWSRSMAARFPADWREVTRQEQTGKDGAPIKTESTQTLDLSALTLEQKRALASIKIGE